MKKAYNFSLSVEEKNLAKVKALLKDNQELFLRIIWNKTEVQLVD